jgi:hypothetical protein
MKQERLHKLGFVIMTKEYVGGVIAGLGVGIIIAFLIFWPEHRVSSPFALLLGCCCTIGGSSLARAAQRKKFQQDDIDEKHDA